MSASASGINRHLTNYASGLAQDRAASLANFIAPIVVTGLASGQYKRYSDKNSFQVLDTSRAVGGTRKRIEFDATDPFFNCQPQGLETTIDDHERAMSGDNVTSLQEAKIRNLVGAGVLSHEKRVFDLIKAAKPATGGIGVWSNPAVNDPVSDLDSQIEAIAITTGRMPNRIVFGIGAWRIFRNHSRVIARQPGADLIGLQPEQAARMMINPEMSVRIGILGGDLNKVGAAKNVQNIVGAEIFLFYGNDAPDQYDASFAKTFTTSPGMVDAVREYRDDRAASDVYYVDWSADIQVCATDSGRRITLS